MGRERNIGWGSDRLRGKRVWQDRASLGEASRRHYAGNIGRAKLKHTVTNWRDHKDITSFYFSRFADDIIEKELWYHFKKWGDVREIFIPNRRNFSGRRYGFVRFKGVQDIPYLAKQLDRIVIGGLKLFVNLPKYGKEMQREAVAATQTRPGTDRKQGVEFRTHHVKPTSYADALTRNIRRPGNQRTSSTFINHKTSSSSVHIEVKPEDTSWLKDAWVGRLKNPAMFERLEDELLWGSGMDVIPRYMGDDQVLLLGLTDTEADQLMSGGRIGGTRVFSSIERWSPSLRAGCRLTWIQCWGIPI